MRKGDGWEKQMMKNEDENEDVNVERMDEIWYNVKETERRRENDWFDEV